jgi:hypothetical protein
MIHNTIASILLVFLVARKWYEYKSTAPDYNEFVNLIVLTTILVLVGVLGWFGL